jgi:hypothetical protein
VTWVLETVPFRFTQRKINAPDLVICEQPIALTFVEFLNVLAGIYPVGPQSPEDRVFKHPSKQTEHAVRLKRCLPQLL